jgi:hypothetical protein
MNTVLDGLQLTSLPSVHPLDRPRFRTSVSEVLSQLDHFVCGLTGHDEMMRFEPYRLSLLCTQCGHQSEGWEVGSPRPRVAA